MTATDENWVVIARIVRPQGRRGEVLAEILTDFPESFEQRKRLFLTPQTSSAHAKPRESHLEAYWLHKGRIVLKFSGVDSIGEAEKLRRHEVVIPREERRPLPGDAVYISDLLGAHVIDVGQGGRQDVGEIVEVLPESAAPATLVVRTESFGPLLIPFVKAYLKRIDLQAQQVEMDLPIGLLSAQAPLTAEEQRRAGESDGN